MQNENTPAEGQNSGKLEAESALRGAACSPLSCTPETDALMERYHTFKGGPASVGDIIKLASRLERERNMWKSRYADAVERLEGKLHCAEDCKCSGRQEIKRLRKILLENVESTHPESKH
jgi:hypothetical protein